MSIRRPRSRYRRRPKNSVSSAAASSASSPPATGRDTREVSYAGRQWQLYSETVTTSDPGLRRVTLWVANMPSSRDTSSVQERALLSLDGFVGVRQ